MSVVFNESFKALVREAFPDNAEKVMSVLDEVVRNKASEDSINFYDLKEKAIHEIKNEIATKDFVRAEIAETREEIKNDIAAVRLELKNDIAELRAELKEDIAAVRTEMAETREELKSDIVAVRLELKADKAELKNDIAGLRTELKEDIAKSKVEIIRWVFGLQFATLALIAAMLKFML